MALHSTKVWKPFDWCVRGGLLKWRSWCSSMWRIFADPSPQQILCSGHGTCETIGYLATIDYNNAYRLWDEDITMGCKCDGGYTGPDCSQRICKYGLDPMYTPLNSPETSGANVRVANFTYGIFTKTAVTLSGEGSDSLLLNAVTLSSLSSLSSLSHSLFHTIPYHTINPYDNHQSNTLSLSHYEVVDKFYYCTLLLVLYPYHGYYCTYYYGYYYT